MFQIFSPLMSCGCGRGKEIIQGLPAGRAAPQPHFLQCGGVLGLPEKKPFQCQNLISKPLSDMSLWMARCLL